MVTGADSKERIENREHTHQWEDREKYAPLKERIENREHTHQGEDREKYAPLTVTETDC